MKRQVDVKLVVYVKGQLTEHGDVRDLKPVFEAVVNGAASGYREWVKSAAMGEDDHCGFDWSVEFSSTKKQIRGKRR